MALNNNSDLPRRKLAGLTVFITGASRGIGKEIGKKIAKDGANVIIAAKTAQPHPKLEGTIYTAAQESLFCALKITLYVIFAADIYVNFTLFQSKKPEANVYPALWTFEMKIKLYRL